MPPSALAEVQSLGGPPTSLGAVVTPANAPPTQQPVTLAQNAPRVIHVGGVAPHSISDPVQDMLFVTHGEPPAGYAEVWDPSEPPADPSQDILAPPWAVEKSGHFQGKGWNWCSKRTSWWFGKPGSWFSVARLSPAGTSYSYAEWRRRE